MSSSAKQRVLDHIADLRGRVHDIPRLEDYEKLLPRLTARVYEGSLDPYDRCGWTASLGHIGVFYCIHGAICVLDGYSEGWSQIRQGLLWQTLRAFVPVRKRWQRETNEPNRRFSLFYIPEGTWEIALQYAHAVATEEHEIADWYAQLLVQVSRGKFENELFMPFHYYATWLAGRHIGEPISVSEEALDIYAPITECWGDNQGLGDSLKECCDYHLSHAILKRDEDHEYEFHWNPYPVFPVEILATLRQREAEGLDTVPAIDHPLMDTPLAEPPREPPQVEDPLLEEFVQRVKKYYPDCPVTL